MMNKYFELSKNDFYSFLIIAPLVILYEFFGYINNFNSPLIIRNGADIYIKNFFQFFGYYSDIIYTFFLIFFLLFIFIRNKNLFLSSSINLVFLFGMIIESCIHSISLLGAMSISSSVLLMAGQTSYSIFENIYLSIGAGVWEEILFRYTLVSISIIMLSKVFNINFFGNYITAILISSSIFSWYHFMGPFGDSINFDIFMYRFIAGIILSLIFIFRGIGIAIYTHTIYDLYLVVFSNY